MEKAAFYGIHIAIKTGVGKRIQYLTEMTIIEFFFQRTRAPSLCIL